MGFERFRAHVAAQLLRAETDRIFASLNRDARRRARNMLSELDRAVDSILNNIAEGNDSIYPARKRQFFDVAIGSSEEARNAFTSLIARGIFSYTTAGKAVSLATVIPKMLRD